MMPDRSFHWMYAGKRRWYCVLGVVNMPYITKKLMEKKLGDRAKKIHVILKGGPPPYRVKCPWYNFMDTGIVRSERDRWLRLGRIHRFGFRGDTLSENPQERSIVRC